jgi:hypothetical protein
MWDDVLSARGRRPSVLADAGAIAGMRYYSLAVTMLQLLTGASAVFDTVLRPPGIIARIAILSLCSYKQYQARRPLNPISKFRPEIKLT